MKIENIINEIESVDPEIYQRLDGRRSAMKSFAKFSGKVAIAALPIAFGSMLNKAYGSPSSPKDAITDVLNFALTLEYLESEFYKAGYAAAMGGTLAIPAGAPLMAIQEIRDHEIAHVNFLKTAITSLGGTPVAFTAASFDFTAKGNFTSVFTDYALFLAVAQTFEDTGVRAYKGQAGNLIGNHDVLTAALNIHSVEARHAAHIRQMRSANGGLIPAGVTVKPWITLNQSGIDSSAVQASYNGEEAIAQAGVNIVNIGGFMISANAASEAFDEPLTKDQVVAIVTPFFA
ncbi:ferritin-like domain-containing protein [Ferruginibacter sp.]|uniref:ferritin-like domain-containing protein n=1 Tax=Ferruginibacter sp. TaxID=1940288 RepID=UPI002659716B|nr:ferritin-like domain-containing protein [Ferruginibacter sp.]